MPTSGNSNYTYNRDQIITAALRKLGVVAQGESPSTVQKNEASEALNLMVKAFIAEGMPLWKIAEYTLTLVADQSSYTVSTRLLKVTQAFRTQNTDLDIPLRIITRDEYNRMGNKTSTGYPIAVYHDPRLSSSIVKIYPTPDTGAASTNTVKLTYQAAFEDFDASTDEPDFPQEWYEALVYCLADRLAPEYGIHPTERRLIKEEAREAKEYAKSFGSEEGSLYFQCDWRGID